MKEFYDKVKGLRAYKGGDGPEYALDAMLKALNYNVSDDNGVSSDLMISGSQIVVITDAPSKNPNITQDVIKAANDKGVCIHFVVADSYYDTDDGVYQRVADETTGTLVSPISGWEIATFTSSYRDSPCRHSPVPRSSQQKRAAPISSRCHSFHISQLTLLMKFSGQARSTITITRPSGSTVTVNVSNDFAVHSEPHPEAGEWLACVSHGTLEIFVNQVFSLDATVLYLKEKSAAGALPVASVSPPTECKCDIIFGCLFILSSRYN